MAWANRLLAVVNTFVGRPSPTNVEAAYQVRAATVNENFQGGMLAAAFCQALGTEVADNSSTNILCKLTLLAGRVTPGDRLTIIEDRPTLRTWCKVVTGTAAVPLVEFADANLQDLTLAGTADYDAIKDDLILLQIAPADSALWPKQSILCGGQHGLTGTNLPWQYGNTETIEAKLLAAVGPAGADTEIQFNDGGNMGGAAHFNYAKAIPAAAFGDNNTMTGPYSFGVGEDNTVSGQDSVAIGNGCEITADRALATGADAKLAVANGRAHAGGAISAIGDNQFGRVPAGLNTHDAALHVLYALPLIVGTAYTVRGLVTARTIVGQVKGWKFEGVCENTGGVSRNVAAFTVAVVSANVGTAAWALTVATNVGADTLDVSVQDAGGAFINWGLILEWEEVTL